MSATAFSTINKVLRFGQADAMLPNECILTNDKHINLRFCYHSAYAHSTV